MAGRVPPGRPSQSSVQLSGTDRTLALSRLEAVGLRTVLTPRAYAVLRHVGLPWILAAASTGLLDYDGAVLSMVAPPDCRLVGHVAMGRVLLRQWLTLSSHGYATHPLSQIIDCPHTCGRLSRILGIDDEHRLLNVTRAGRPAAPTPAPLGAEVPSGPPLREPPPPAAIQ